MPTLEWETAYDHRGFLIWLRYVDCGRWGYILTGWLPNYAWPPLRQDQYWLLGSDRHNYA